MKNHIENDIRLFERNLHEDYLFIRYHHNSDHLDYSSVFEKVCPDGSISEHRYDKEKSYKEALFHALEPRKEYPTCEVISLPSKSTKTSFPFEQLVTKRRSLRNTMKHVLSMEDIAYLLENSVGTTAKSTDKNTNKTYYLRATPSGGALYPIEVLLIPLNVSGLMLDLYHYNVYDHSLGRLGKQLSSKDISKIFYNRDTVTNSSAIFVLVSCFRRSAIKYGERSYRLILTEGGAILEHIALASEAIGLRSVMLGGFKDELLNEIIGCNGIQDSVIMCGTVGKEGPQ